MQEQDFPGVPPCVGTMLTKNASEVWEQLQKYEIDKDGKCQELARCNNIIYDIMMEDLDSDTKMEDYEAS